MSQLVQHFGGCLLALSSPRIATILSFQSGAGKVLHIVPDQEDDDTDIAIGKLKEKMCQEINKIN